MLDAPNYDPIPPGHGERAPARPNDSRCPCGFPTAGYEECPNCGRSTREEA